MGAQWRRPVPAVPPARTVRRAAGLQPLLATAAALTALAWPAAASAQSFRATEGNTYFGKSADGGREGNCVWEVSVDRRVVVTRDPGANRLVYTMHLRRERSARFLGGSKADRLECDPGETTHLSTLRFYIDQEDRASTDYSATVVESSPGVLDTFKVGDRISGRVEVYDGGRGLAFSGEDFIAGVARVLARGFTNRVGPEQEFHRPARTPDIVVSCKVVSADGSTTSRVSSGQGNATGPGGASSYTRSGSESSTQSCLAQGWQNITKSVSVWINERRCDGYACDIADNTFKWKQWELNRYTGQMRDGCYVYECQKAATTQRF